MNRAFTLLELLAAIMIGSLIMLMIAGGLQTAIKSWESVQTKVSQNYNRRNVLDLMKRQASSLFFKSEADQLSMSERGTRRGNVMNRKRDDDPRRTGAAAHAPGRIGGNTSGEEGGVEFSLPDGAHYFQGNLQELNFVSTVSFLSDFPGQVAVRYYVVQGQPGDDESFTDLESTRTANETVDDGELMAADMIQGDLYLVLEETNLFLSAAADEGFGEEMDEGNLSLMNTMDFSSENESLSQTNATNTMTLLGPLREFSIRYRMRPEEGDNMNVSSTDEYTWSEIWDVEEEGYYPSAIEFLIYYEDLLRGEEVPLEDLDSIRLVIPVYDARNLARGGSNAPF